MKEHSTSNSVSPGSPSSTMASSSKTAVDSTQQRLEELELLEVSSSKGTQQNEHELLTAPVMTRGAMLEAGITDHSAQYGVLGKILSICTRDPGNGQDRLDIPEDPRLYLNTNSPFSALVCGVQGSGKSHTVSAMLENMLIPGDRRIGQLSKPLCGLVLHMSEGGPESSPSEAAWLAMSDSKQAQNVKIRVYVPPSSFKTMQAVYSPLGRNVIVEPLYFTEDELDAQAFLSMMAVGTSENAPLYVQIILSILRELGENYSYSSFKLKLEDARKDFNPAQRTGLKQRMALMDAFLDHTVEKKRAKAARFSDGQITIIDLSDPFIDAASACGVFEIITRIFVRARVNTGKVLVVDEAHKYLNTVEGSSGLTNSLLSLIREQRHKGMRVIISTQEPTVVPAVLIDLCSIVILHRFSSPAWWEHVVKHVSADLSSGGAFDRVVKLRTGEAIVLAPSGLCMYRTTKGARIVGQFGRRYLHVRTRRRITKDGGASINVL